MTHILYGNNMHKDNISVGPGTFLLEAAHCRALQHLYSNTTCSMCVQSTSESDIVPKLPGHIIQCCFSARLWPFSLVYVGPFCFLFQGDGCQSQRARPTLSRQPSQTLTSNPRLLLRLEKKKKKSRENIKKKTVSASPHCWPLSP